ncbi:hypothetical protein ABWK63_11410, partial [Bacillus safensis]
MLKSTNQRIIRATMDLLTEKGYQKPSKADGIYCWHRKPDRRCHRSKRSGNPNGRRRLCLLPSA